MTKVTEGGIRGEVIRRWIQAGKPKWDYERTKAKVQAVDHAFATNGKTPAPRLRQELLSQNWTYVSMWVKGCKFPWLEPYLD